MQVNLNTKQNNQNFGMAFHTNDAVNNVLKSRIKSKIQLEQLNKIIQEQNSNKYFDISLFANGKNKLSANIYSKNTNEYICKPYSENILTKLFGGPLGFIKKLSKIANKEAEKMHSNLDYDSVLNKMEQQI